MRKVTVICFVSLAALTMGCHDNLSKKEQIETKAAHAVEGDHTPQLCFSNEIAHQDGSGLVDQENLRLTFDGDSVKGSFKWIPAEKGGLSGKLSGTHKDNVMDVLYDEINSDGPIRLTISLSANEATITSAEESFGSFTIEKSTCD